MPYILIQITKENVSTAQKQQLIQEATDLVVRVLHKDPATTFVVIDEIDTDNWGWQANQFRLYVIDKE